MPAESSSPARKIPAVERLLQILDDQDLPRPIVVEIVREYLGELRRASSIPDSPEIVANLKRRLDEVRLTRIQSVVNATGILLHTNLGRAPLSGSAVRALADLAAGYSNLEFDLNTGGRGNRGKYVERLAAQLCEAEAATIVNNCAAALVLVLRVLAKERKEVVISRGELVQIGGGFRIPDILETSGAKLREVGTTNRTTLEDYHKAMGADTALILKVHRSNFVMSGFVESPDTALLVALARERGVPFVEDLGSGALVTTESFGMRHERMAKEVVAAGADMVCFSGDKLLGGPQAGLIAGKKHWIQSLKEDPFFRALRCDKLILTAMQTTLESYLSLEGSGTKRGCRNPDVPVLEMLAQSREALMQRADELKAACSGMPLKTKIVEGNCEIGGGTLPEVRLRSVALAVKPTVRSVEECAQTLRTGQPAVIGYVSEGWLCFDLRTVFPEQDPLLIECLRRVL